VLAGGCGLGWVGLGCGGLALCSPQLRNVVNNFTIRVSTVVGWLRSLAVCWLRAWQANWLVGGFLVGAAVGAAWRHAAMEVCATKVHEYCTLPRRHCPFHATFVL
jgi:hypothetical protein